MKPPKLFTTETIEENGKVTPIFSYKFWLALILLPIFLLWKCLEYIHIITIMIFGGLFFYFGISDFLKNAWWDTTLYLIVGLALLVAPVLFMFDKDK